MKIMKVILALVARIKSIDLDDGTNLLQTGILQHHAQGFDFDETRWVQKDGYHIYEQCLNFDEAKYDERPPMCPKKKDR